MHSCFTEKFGIPRQPGLAQYATGEIELFGEYGREELVRKLEQFTHIWVSFIFHEVIQEGWRPTVRPPWLGGQKRVGVLASRSPHRPNFLGLSVVRLEQVTRVKGKVILHISGLDMLDKTPVVDIRPYLPYSDRVDDAGSGYTKIIESEDVKVTFTESVARFCEKYQVQTGRKLSKLLEEVIQQDPRPASQRTVGREFGMLLWDVNTRFLYKDEDLVEIVSCEVKEEG